MDVCLIFTLLVLCECLVKYVAAQTGIPPCGILYNRDETSLLRNGFMKCYDQPYSHITTSAELAACTGTNVVFVGAKSNSSTTSIALGAFGLSSNVYTVTSSTTTAYLDPGGAYWYNYPNWGFGFSGVSTVNIYYCDYGQAAGDCAYRLCWNLDEGLGGYRVGCTENLNSDSVRRKVMYKGNQVYSCTSVCNTGATRLVSGTSPLTGRVEVCYNNTWGTVCDNMWSNLDAQVVCRQLGFIGGTALPNAYFGQGNGSVLLDNLNCIGSENSLLNCSNSGVGVTSCTHAHDASVNCTAVPVCGILYSYDEPTLALSGYTKCYDQPYSHITTSAELAACKGSTWVFVGAKNNINATNIVLGAFGYSSFVYTPTTSTTTAYLDTRGGAYWYDYTNWGFGFTAVPTVNIFYCDYGQAAGDCAYRLCWNLDEGLGGYRVGCTENLNSDSVRRKVMYKGNQVYTCVPDINECAIQNGNCSQLCTNTLGSYSCSCLAGYVLNVDGRNCTHINECAINNGNCQQICTNAPGTYKCSCMSGYVLALDNVTCTDINECATQNGNCSQLCTNTLGSYSCSCLAGYVLNVDGRNCTHINECAINNGNCQQICTNAPGTYKCSCMSGYVLALDNVTCTDINECATQNGNCSQLCTNTLGSYACSCLAGYVLNVDGRNCTGPIELIQLRLTEVHNCSNWKLDIPKVQLLTQLIENSVNSLCSCAFSIYNSSIYCFDTVSITLRGSSETSWVMDFQDWVFSKNPTVNIQGTTLFVDQNCKVIIQSWNEAGCQSTMMAGELNQTPQVGIIVGVVLALIIAVGVILFLILALWRYRKVKNVPFRNPIYSKDNVAQYDTTLNPAYQVIRDLPPSAAIPPLYDYATVNNTATKDIYEIPGGNGSINNYEYFGSSTNNDETGNKDVSNTSGNTSINTYDTIGDLAINSSTIVEGMNEKKEL